MKHTKQWGDSRSHSGSSEGFWESISVRKRLLSRSLRFRVCVGAIVINDFRFLYTPPTKACVKAQELGYRNTKRLPRAALLGWILPQIRIAQCHPVLLQVSFYVFGLLWLVPCSDGQRGFSKCPENQQGQRCVLGSGAKRCQTRLVSARWEGAVFPCPVGRVIPREVSQSRCLGARDPSRAG